MKSEQSEAVDNRPFLEVFPAFPWPLSAVSNPPHLGGVPVSAGVPPCWASPVLVPAAVTTSMTPPLGLFFTASASYKIHLVSG